MGAVKKKVKKTKRKVSSTTKKRAVMKKAVKKVTAEIKKAAPAPSALEVVGEVTHYFPHASAGVIKLSKDLKAGDVVQIKGHTTDFKQAVESIQIDHVPVSEAKKGQEIGIKIKDRVRIGDTVYKL